MKILCCRKYEKYLNKDHCGFFNEGAACPFYQGTAWNSTRELLADLNRPKWSVGEVIKPFKCGMLGRASLQRRSGRRRRASSRGAGTA
ncbi:MAG TPA: hypothetical protein VMU60_06180 [Syntrophobacteria bacterium]|nr:hypothetical protein [Syntrophobacteria bacterium]